MKRISLLLTLIMLTISGITAQEAYERKVFVSPSGDSLNYRLLRPEQIKKGEKYPLVLFLHGAGERGSDNQKQLTHGSQMFLNPVNREKYPAFVLFPQCPEDGYWAYSQRPASFTPAGMQAEKVMPKAFQSVKALLDSYLAMPEVDKSRIYIVGLSMGAMGTFDIVARYPEIFAAAIPICGVVDPSRLAAAKDVKFRIFHGDNDDIVPVEGSRAAYKALRAAGADVEYIEFPGCNHGSWNPAFNYPGFMDWLFSQHR